MTTRYPVRVATGATRLALAGVLLPLLLGSPALAQAPESSAPAAAGQETERARIDVQFASVHEVQVAISTQVGLNATVVPSAKALLVIGPPDRIRRAIELANELDSRAAELEKERQERQFEKEERAKDREHFAVVEQQKRLAELALTIDFPGGTVAEYLEFVQKASGFDNIVVGDEAILALKMPRVKVRRVTGTAAVLLLKTLRFDSNGNDMRLAVDVIPGDPEGVGIDAMPVLVVAFDERSRGAIPSAALVTQVMNLAAYQKHEPETVKALLGALDVAVKMQGNPKDVEIKLHEGTGLLFVRGSISDVDLVNETVNTFIADRSPPSGK